jgi:hypothetical protein
MGAIKLFERFADPRECLNLIGRGVSLGIATGCSLGHAARGAGINDQNHLGATASMGIRVSVSLPATAAKNFGLRLWPCNMAPVPASARETPDQAEKR